MTGSQGEERLAGLLADADRRAVRPVVRRLDPARIETLHRHRLVRRGVAWSAALLLGGALCWAQWMLVHRSTAAPAIPSVAVAPAADLSVLVDVLAGGDPMDAWIDQLTAEAEAAALDARIAVLRVEARHAARTSTKPR